MSLLLLYLLASADGAFSGFRAAAGRNSLLKKNGYYTRAMVIGFIASQAVLIGFVIVAHQMWRVETSAGRDQTLAFAERLLVIFVPYAMLTFLAFGFRLVPIVDIQCMSSILILGPFTAIRPVVAGAGMVWAVRPENKGTVVVFALLVIAAMFAVERGLEAYYRRKMRRT